MIQESRYWSELHFERHLTPPAACMQRQYTFVAIISKSHATEAIRIGNEGPLRRQTDRQTGSNTDLPVVLVFSLFYLNKYDNTVDIFQNWMSV